MRVLCKTLLRLGQATTVAATIVAASGMLGANGSPPIAAIGDVALNLAAAQSEAEKLRQKVTAAARCRACIQSVACGRAPRSYPTGTAAAAVRFIVPAG
jgi:hypothetical protein